MKVVMRVFGLVVMTVFVSVERLEILKDEKMAAK